MGTAADDHAVDDGDVYQYILVHKISYDDNGPNDDDVDDAILSIRLNFMFKVSI